jgi:integrase
MAKLEKRRDSDGRIRFTFRYIDVDGSRKRHTPDVETEHEALRIMAEVRARIARGIVGVPDEGANERQASTIRLSAMLDRWLREAHSTSKNPEGHRTQVKGSIAQVIAVLGDVAIGGMRRGDISRMLAEWERQGLAATTQNSRLSALSRLWIWGQDAGLIADGAANPTRRMMKKAAQHSIDFYSKAEIVEIFAAARANHALHTLIAAALYTGLRKGELYGLRWRDINPHNATIRVERSYRSTPKSGRARTVPLHPRLAPLLVAWRPGCPKTDEDLVFPFVTATGAVRMGKSGDDNDPALLRILRQARVHIPEKPWHAFRHTFASHYVMAGGNLAALQRHLGHHSIEQTMAYAHLAPDFAAADLARLNFDPAPLSTTAAPPAEVIPFPRPSRRAKS